MRIETPEDYAAWWQECQAHPGPGDAHPPLVQHPNEIATAKAVEAGIYTADAVGSHVNPASSS